MASLDTLLFPTSLDLRQYSSVVLKNNLIRVTFFQFCDGSSPRKNTFSPKEL